VRLYCFRTGSNLPNLGVKAETPAVFWENVSLVGVGLLGGSLGLALRERKLAGRVTGFVRRPMSIRESEEAGAVDRATLELRAAVENADLVVLCTPVGQMKGLVEQVLPFLKRGAILTDVGSVKAGLCKQLGPLVASVGAHFVGSHPMAGSEKSGVQAARADLFAGAICVVTPGLCANRKAVREVERLWTSVGARVLRMTAEQHDMLVSRSSHLPHVLAVTLANYVLGRKPVAQQALLCANGFRDTTRVASGSPEMWRDIAVANRRHLKKALQGYARELSKFARALESGSGRRLGQHFETAKRRRDEWALRGGSPSFE